MVDAVRHLRAAEPFADLPPRELLALSERARAHRYADGDRLVGQGDPGAEVHVVVRGTVRVLVDGIEVARRGPGEIVGELALVTGGPRSATLVAAGPVGTLGLDPATFDALLRERQEVATALVGSLSRRLAAPRPAAR
jgi:CRP-like cAMP-binding protein